jgi:hypothetical protein
MLAPGCASCASRVIILLARVLTHDLQHNLHDGGIMNPSSSLLIYIRSMFYPHFRSRDDRFLAGFLLLMLAPLTRSIVGYVILTGFPLLSLAPLRRIRPLLLPHLLSTCRRPPRAPKPVTAFLVITSSRPTRVTIFSSSLSSAILLRGKPT